MVSVEIDRQDAEYLGTLSAREWIKIRPAQDIVQIIMEHVQVVKDGCRFWKAPAEFRRCLRHHGHKFPFYGGIAEVPW